MSRWHLHHRNSAVQSCHPAILPWHARHPACTLMHNAHSLICRVPSSMQQSLQQPLAAAAGIQTGHQDLVLVGKQAAKSHRGRDAPIHSVDLHCKALQLGGAHQLSAGGRRLSNHPMHAADRAELPASRAPGHPLQPVAMLRPHRMHHTCKPAGPQLRACCAGQLCRPGRSGLLKIKH